MRHDHDTVLTALFDTFDTKTGQGVISGGGGIVCSAWQSLYLR